MTVGIPIVGLGTSEMPHVITNKVSGFIGNNINWLIEKMRFLLRNPEDAKKIGNEGKKIAEQRFDINRFTNEWEYLFEEVIESYKLKSQTTITKTQINSNTQIFK